MTKPRLGDAGLEPPRDPRKKPQGERPLREGEAARLRGEHDAALRLYGRAIIEDPSLIPAWVGQVWCLIEQGDLDEALLWADRGLEAHPDNGELIAMKAIVLARRGEAGKPPTFEPQSPLAWWARGDLLVATNEKTAEQCFQKAAGEPLLELAIGRSYLTANQPASARPWLQKATEKLPDNPLAWLHLGLCSVELGLLDAGRSAYSESLRVRPGFAPAQDALARLDAAGAVDKLKAWWRRRDVK